jgi:peptidoglycan LD-endopeptidase LytH
VHGRRLLSMLGVAFCAGALVATWGLAKMTPRGPAGRERARPVDGLAYDPTPLAPATLPGVAPRDSGTGSLTTGRSADAARGTAGETEAVADLRARKLLIPVAGVQRSDLSDTFTAERGAGTHEALDILALRNTPVRAVEDGRIARLFTSKRGGLSIYQFDSNERYCYYYAHLERYADDLAESQRVTRGQVIGYVGTSGNAPENTPHLHFAVFVLGPEKHWWEGTPINPYPLFR